jgi:hypothetical protein
LRIAEFGLRIENNAVLINPQSEFRNPQLLWGAGGRKISPLDNSSAEAAHAAPCAGEGRRGGTTCHAGAPGGTGRIAGVRGPSGPAAPPA